MEQHWHHKLCRSLLERNLNYKRLIIIMMLLCFVCLMDVTSIVHVIYGRPVTPVNEVCAILSESNHRSGIYYNPTITGNQLASTTLCC